MNLNGYFLMRGKHNSLDEAVDYAEANNQSVILTGAPMTMRSGANPDLICDPSRMVTSAKVDLAKNTVTVIGSPEYHAKI